MAHGKTWTGVCPYCGVESGHLNNHVRMSTGEHGEQGTYPDDWSSDTRERQPTDPASEQQQAAAGPESDPGGNPGDRTVEGLEADSDDESAESRVLVVTDSIDDARSYECGECGASVPYLAVECDECGHDGLTWRVPA